MAARPAPLDFAAQLGITPLAVQPTVYPEAAALAVAVPTTQVQTTTTAWATTVRAPTVIHWGGGPVSQTMARWLATKHTWTIHHGKAQPVPIAPVTTVTTTRTVTSTATAAVIAPVMTTVTTTTPRSFEEAPPAPVVPMASAQGPPAAMGRPHVRGVGDPAVIAGP
jgi:hypothetical protein